jgi:hypothetical protein
MTPETASYRVSLVVQVASLVLSVVNLSVRGDPQRSLQELYAPLVSAGIPFVTINGNHDVEQTSVWNATRLKQYTKSVAKLSGQGNVHISDGINKLFTLWFFEYPAHHESSDGYIANTVCAHCTLRWITHASVRWFFRAAEQVETTGIAFLHVPLPEFDDMHDTGTVVDGVQRERVSSAAFDAGLFSAFKESGKIIGVAVAHDHNNDHCKVVKGISLCYSGVSSYTATASSGVHRRARVFDLHVDKTVTTYKRLDDDDLTIVDVRVL